LLAGYDTAEGRHNKLHQAMVLVVGLLRFAGWHACLNVWRMVVCVWLICGGQCGVCGVCSCVVACVRAFVVVCGFVCC
jgi:hypothetical protein